MKRSEFLKKIEKRLRTRRNELLASLAGELGQFRLTTDPLVGDSADLAVEEDYGQINANLASVVTDELRQINDALNRLAQGTYGVCEVCGRPIPIARLELLPFATQCVRCRQALEQERRWSTDVEHWGRVPEQAEDEIEETETDFEAVASELAA